MGIAGKKLTTNKNFFFNENKIFGIGSVGKISIAVTSYHLFENKKIDIDVPVDLGRFYFFDNKNRDSGILKLFQKKQKITLRLAILLMLSISDNFATNVVLESIGGKKAVNQLMRSLGLLNSKILVNKIDEYLFYEANHDFSQSTAFETLTLLELLQNYKILTKKSSEEILGFMSMEGAPYRILRYLPLPKNVFDKKLEIVKNFSKGGTFPRIGVCSDVGIVYTKDNQKLIFVGFTKNFVDKENPYLRHTAVDHISSLFLAKVGQFLYNYLK